MPLYDYVCPECEHSFEAVVFGVGETSGPLQFAVPVSADGTAVLYRSGHVRFRFPSTPPSLQFPLPNPTDPVVADYAKLTGYWVRARLTQANYESAPAVIAITTNTVPARQALTVRSETVGGSFGTPGQTFTLAHAPVLPGTLQITVDEGLAGASAGSAS